MDQQFSDFVVDHLAIAVEDLEASIAVYTKGLGFELLEQRTTAGESTSMVSAVVKKGPVILVLIQGLQPESQVSRFISQFGPGVQHVAFLVPNMEAAIADLAGAGVEPEFDIIEGDGIRQVFMQRTKETGVRFELIERNGGQFNDESVNKLFRNFEERDLV